MLKTPRTSNHLLWLAAAVVCAVTLAAQSTERTRVESQARRANERLVALQREADALAKEQRSLIVELRRIEIERDLKTEQLRELEADAQIVARELGNIGNRIDALEEEIAAMRPVLESRIVELYKLGGAGYARLLLNVSDPREFGRAYRMVAAVAALDRQRADLLRHNVVQLRAAHEALEQRQAQMAKLQRDARAARAAAERAAAARAQLVNEIDRRRDLTAELANELQVAQARLQQTLGAIKAGVPHASAEGSALPIRPFRGDLQWPIAGRMLTPFGRRSARIANAPAQNGVQFAAPEGSPVHAIHDGTVAHAGPFTGYGTLVIIDHGAQTYSLYGQLAMSQVQRGTRVEGGDLVGTAGRILAGIPGIYFEMRVDGDAVDPLEWLRKQP